MKTLDDYKEIFKPELTEDERKEFSRRFLAAILVSVAHPSVKGEVAEALETIRSEDLQ